MSRRALEDALREGGEKVTQGRLRIDAGRALERLRDFRFADPAHWVLEVLRAAVLSGAKKVVVRTDADDVEVSFDGAPFPPEAMAHLLEQALNPGTTDDERRTRLLALGAAGALGVGARFVTVLSGGVQLTLTPSGVETSKATVAGTHLHLRKALGWRVAAALVRGAPEAAAVTERAHRLPAALTLNGQRVRTDDPSSAGGDTRTAQGPGWRLVATLPPGPPLPASALDLDVAGVLVAKRELVLPGVQVRAWLRADGVRRNASGSDVVDDDLTFQQARSALRELSLELLGRLVATQDALDDAWRHVFVERLLAGIPMKRRGAAAPVTAFPPVPRALTEASTEERQRARELLAGAKVIPGAGGEWYALAQLEAAARSDGRLLVAEARYPEGVCPVPTVYLPPGSVLEPLLPQVKRVDVAPIVQRTARVAERRRTVAELRPEPAVLKEGDWVARAPITEGGLEGEVALHGGGHGAFVRVLHDGRLLEAGEAPTLAPLRLRAVVNVKRPLADAYFDLLAPTRALGLVQQAVEAAATQAVLQALPDEAVLPHARDVLHRLAVGRERPLDDLPAALRAAPLVPCVQAPDVSLDTLLGEPSWAFVRGRWPHGRLDGSRVLLLDDALHAVLSRYGSRRLQDVSRQLEHEQEVRRRLAAPKQRPHLADAVVRTEVSGPGVQGVVGIPRAASARLEVTLLRDGLALETTELTARYQHGVASVECAQLQPNARWTGAVRDEAFARVTDALARAERRLALALAASPEASRTPGGRQYTLAFLRKELTPFDARTLDEVTRAFAEAPLFDSVHGPRSLRELRAATLGGEPLLWLPPGAQPGPVPAALPVLVVPEHVAQALADALRCAHALAGPRLEVLAARQRLELLPEHPFSLAAALPLQGESTVEDTRTLAGLGAGVEASAAVHVTVEHRLVRVEKLACALPLVAVVECPSLLPTADGALTSAQHALVSRALAEAARALTRRALATPEQPDALRALRLAAGRHLDASLPEADSHALCTLALFPCTDGQARSVEALSKAPSRRMVSTAAEGTLPDRQPIVQAVEESTKVAVRRWGTVEQVDAALAAQNEALAARAAVPAVDVVSSPAASPWRLRVEEAAARGELVVSRERAGRLELLLDRRPLVTLAGALAGPLTATVEAPLITPKPGFTGVVDDEALRAVVDTLADAAQALASEVATRPESEGDAVARVALAFWAAGRDAWTWRNKKKPRKGKGKSKARKAEAEARPVRHPLVEQPLLRRTDGARCSVGDLIERGRVEFAVAGGSFLEADRSAWWPRDGELALAQGLGLALEDVTADLEFAATLRARPRYVPVVPLRGGWRAPVTGPELTGEVRLADQPGRELVVEVLHQGVLVETATLEGAVGGVARVEGAALTPDARWTRVKRDARFKALLAAVDAALAQALGERLASRDGPWQGWAMQEVELFAAGHQALAKVVPGLELFADLFGQPVTVGAALAAGEHTRRVQVADRDTPAPEDGRLVLAAWPSTVEVLRRLGLEAEDVTAELRRRGELQGALAARRLATLAWGGPALVRLPLAAPPLTGELALSDDGSAGITLAREGIAVGPLEESWPGVVGVVDVAELSVDAAWTKFTLTHAQRDAIRAQVERLYEALAAAAPGLDAAQRPLAAASALEWLEAQGIEAAGHLDRLTGVPRAIAEAPLFETLQGERVGLFAVATEILTHGRVAVAASRRFSPGPGNRLVLAAASERDAWLGALERLLGKSRVWRVKDLAEWKQATVEADPPEGAPEAVGLRFLRRQVRLVSAGALGRLAPGDLEDVKLHRGGGEVPIRYDARRRLGLLDPEHPLIAQTLKEAKQRPERVWVLLTALFGHVNRELEHVTDEHEAKLLLALAGHLAANPKLLAAPEE